MHDGLANTLSDSVAYWPRRMPMMWKHRKSATGRVQVGRCRRRRSRVSWARSFTAAFAAVSPEHTKTKTLRQVGHGIEAWYVAVVPVNDNLREERARLSQQTRRKGVPHGEQDRLPERGCVIEAAGARLAGSAVCSGSGLVRIARSEQHLVAVAQRCPSARPMFPVPMMPIFIASLRSALPLISLCGSRFARSMAGCRKCLTVRPISPRRG